MTHEFRADLHCHSTCSDGTKTPDQLIAMAKEIGLQGLSITDHDSAESYKDAISMAKKAEITLLTGIELSAHLKDKSVHILGYGFDLNSQSINELCLWHTKRRKDRNVKMLKELAKLDMPIDYEELETAVPVEFQSYNRTIGRPHIAFAMVKRGYVVDTQEAFNKYLGESKPCFVQGATFGVDDTIRVIHEAKGIAVIAHPHLIKDANLINNLLTKKFDGIECYYGKFLASNHEKWLKVTKKKNWLITGGSDFHGEAKPNIPLGCSWVGEEHFQAILNRIASIHGK